MKGGIQRCIEKSAAVSLLGVEADREPSLAWTKQTRKGTWPAPIDATGGRGDLVL